MSPPATLVDVVRWDGPARHLGRRGRGPASSPVSRRTFLKAAGAAGVGLALTLVGRIPIAQAQCAPEGQLHTDIRPDCYANYNYPDCGPSPGCSVCCEVPAYWHRRTGAYRNRPNRCPPSSQWDGWWWMGTQGCPPGCVRQFRCHDGCRNVSGSWISTICIWTHQCACP